MFCLWLFSVAVISLSHMLPAWLLTLTLLYMCTSICVLGALPLKYLLRVSQHHSPPSQSPPQRPQLHWRSLCYARFFSDVYCWIMSVFYLDIIKQHETNLSAEKSNILFSIPQLCSNNLQNLVKLYNHFLFVVKNFYSVMVLIRDLNILITVS